MYFLVPGGYLIGMAPRASRQREQARRGEISTQMTTGMEHAGRKSREWMISAPQSNERA